MDVEVGTAPPLERATSTVSEHPVVQK